MQEDKSGEFLGMGLAVPSEDSTSSVLSYRTSHQEAVHSAFSVTSKTREKRAKQSTLVFLKRMPQSGRPGAPQVSVSSQEGTVPCALLQLNFQWSVSRRFYE